MYPRLLPICLIAMLVTQSTVAERAQAGAPPDAHAVRRRSSRATSSRISAAVPFLSDIVKRDSTSELSMVRVSPNKYPSDMHRAIRSVARNFIGKPDSTGELSDAKRNVDRAYIGKRNLERNFIGKRGEDRDDFQEKRNLDRSSIGKMKSGWDSTGNKGINRNFIGKRNINRDFLGKRNIDRDFFGKRSITRDFIGKRNINRDFFGKRNINREFFGKRNINRDFLGKRNINRDFFGKRNINRDFFGKRNINRDFIGKRSINRDFIGKRSVNRDFFGKRNINRDFFGKRSMNRDFFGKRGIDGDFLEKRNQNRYYSLTGAENEEWTKKRSMMEGLESEKNDEESRYKDIVTPNDERLTPSLDVHDKHAFASDNTDLLQRLDASPSVYSDHSHAWYYPGKLDLESAGEPAA